MSISTDTTLIIINLIITSFTALLLPLIKSLSFVLKRVKYSQCCGSRIDIRTSEIQKDKKNSLV